MHDSKITNIAPKKMHDSKTTFFSGKACFKGATIPFREVYSVQQQIFVNFRECFQLFCSWLVGHGFFCFDKVANLEV